MTSPITVQSLATPRGSAAFQDLLHSVSPREQQILLGKRVFETVTNKGKRHGYCASTCAEKRKPGKGQILDTLKALVHE